MYKKRKKRNKRLKVIIGVEIHFTYKVEYRIHLIDR